MKTWGSGNHPMREVVKLWPDPGGAMSKSLVCVLVCACSYEGVTISGQVKAQIVGPPPNSLRVAVVYSPEQGHHKANSMAIPTSFPVDFTFDVPGPPYGAFEDK